MSQNYYNMHDLQLFFPDLSKKIELIFQSINNKQQTLNN